MYGKIILATIICVIECHNELFDFFVGIPKDFGWGIRSLTRSSVLYGGTD